LPQAYTCASLVRIKEDHEQAHTGAGYQCRSGDHRLQVTTTAATILYAQRTQPIVVAQLAINTVDAIATKITQ
jgi:hypothetical protein